METPDVKVQTLHSQQYPILAVAEHLRLLLDIAALNHLEGRVEPTQAKIPGSSHEKSHVEPLINIGGTFQVTEPSSLTRLLTCSYGINATAGL